MPSWQRKERQSLDLLQAWKFSTVPAQVREAHAQITATMEDFTSPTTVAGQLTFGFRPRFHFSSGGVTTVVTITIATTAENTGPEITGSP